VPHQAALGRPQEPVRPPAAVKPPAAARWLWRGYLDAYAHEMREDNRQQSNGAQYLIVAGAHRIVSQQ